MSGSCCRVSPCVFVVLSGAILSAGLAVDAYRRRPADPPPRALRVVRPACDPSAVATGSIYIAYREVVMAMRGDGSGKTLLPFRAQGAPSSLVYGDDPLRDRWWLSVEQDGRAHEWTVDTAIPPHPHRELFACRLDPQVPGGVRRIALTDLYGRVLLSTVDVPQWSNDGKDSFISFRGRDLSPALERRPDGTTALELDLLGESRLYRLPVRGAELEEAVRAGQWSPLTADKLEDWGSAPMPIHWSPCGKAFVTYARDRTSRLMVASAGGTVVLQETRPDGPAWMQQWMQSPRWSPDGRNIVVTSGAAWTIGAAAGCAPLNLTGEEWLLGACVWSPDGNFVLGRRAADSAVGGGELVRWRSDGSQAAVLTGELDPREVLQVVAWVGNERAATARPYTDRSEVEGDSFPWDSETPDWRRALAEWDRRTPGARPSGHRPG